MSHPKNRTPQVVGGMDANGDPQALKTTTDGELILGATSEINLDRTNDEVTTYGAQATYANGASDSVTTTETELLAANANRIGFIVNYHSGTTTLFVGLAGVTSTAYIWKVEPSEVLIEKDYVPTGAIKAITTSGTVTAISSDVTP